MKSWRELLALAEDKAFWTSRVRSEHAATVSGSCGTGQTRCGGQLGPVHSGMMSTIVVEVR